MKDFVRVFRSSTGDVYHIELSENHSILSQKTIGALDDISVVGVELRRLSGKNPTGHEVLSAIEGVIADFFIEHKNSIICYYCDFINPIPHTSKNTMPPQEYRSRLFDRMFQRYTRHHGMIDARLSVVEIEGINEKYYFHVIYRESHSLLAAMIGRELKDGFGK